jgi:ribose transport system substrate-binding protein
VKTFLMWALLIGVAMLGVAGCGDDSSTTGAGGKKKILIGVIAKSASNDVFQAAHAGAQDAAKEIKDSATELGKKYGGANIEVTIDIRTPTAEDPERQAVSIDELVRQGANGILVSCSEAKTLTKAINKAVDAGVVVVCFDSDAPDSKRLTCYGCDDIVCGQKVATALSAAMDDKGLVAILAGNQSAPNLQKRVQGVQDVLKTKPGIKMLDVGPIYHEESADAAAAKIQEIQRQHPEITGWALVGGWPLFAKDALKWEPGSVKVVSVDALPQQLPYVEKGYVVELLGQDCYGWGHRGVDILLDKIVNGKDPAKKIVDELTPVTKENAATYGKNWEKWLKKSN